ncbi:uncharacterized protein znf142 [Stigmatopora nigra]
MCEICAYACKRPAELRHHMLIKHSVEGHPASAHKCRYCSYTTSFKQALQNHENCKHTRLKQYHCALCLYSSFSGVSLFLHKKKAHGYLPGDKAWLENYVAKEKERNLKNMLLVQESSEKTTKECVRMKQTLPEASVEQIASVAHSQAVPSLDANQILMNEGLSDGLQPEPSPEYCTLVLTTLTPEGETSPLPIVDSASNVLASNTNTNSAKEESRTSPQDRSQRSPYNPNKTIPDTPPEKNPIPGLDPNTHPSKKVEIPSPTADQNNSSCQKRKKHVQKVGDEPQILEGPKSVPFSGSDVRLEEKQENTNPIQIPIYTSKPKPLAKTQIVAQERRRKARNPISSASPHSCHYCPFTTTRRYRLEAHESLHTGTGRHACGVCDKTFGAATKLRQHEARTHRGEPTLPCLLCDYHAYTADDVRRHARRCHEANSDQHCLDCQARFSSKAALRNHRQRAHPTYDLNDPGESTRSKQQRSKHGQTLGVETSKGTHLAQNLLDQSSLDQVLQHGNSKTACRHPRKRLYECPDCKYSTANKQKMTWHLRIHTGEKPYRCERCSYACVDPSRLKLHMRVHQDEKKYLCPECGYKCKWATQLKYHMTKHTGEKRYTCNQCEYRTNRADALRAHQTTRHCDVRAYVCEECGKAFKSNFILKTHQRQHGERPHYSCGICHKAFRWPAGLRHHFLSHGNRLPFGCRQCPYRAKQRFQVVKHLKRHHPGTSADQGVLKDSDVGVLTLREAMRGEPDQTESGEEAKK